MKLLFVTPPINWPLQSGGDIRKWQTLQGLCDAGDVDVVIFQGPAAEISGPAYARCGTLYPIGQALAKSRTFQSDSYQRTAGRIALTASTARPYEYGHNPDKHLKNWFSSLVAHGGYDVVWVVKAESAMTLSWRDPVRTILDADDYDHVREFQILRTTPWYGAKICNYTNVAKLAVWERQLPRWFARVARCSREDLARMPSRNGVVIPNGTHVGDAPPLRRPSNRVLFVGLLGYEPNRIGLEWFVRQAWPLVRKNLPGAGLDIVGRGASDWLKSLDGQDGIRVHGFVENLGPMWETAGVSIVPLLAGSGTRLKILESLAHSVPVVSTTIGAYGLELTADQGVVRADDLEGFARSCGELLGQPARNASLGEAGRQIVARRYDWRSIRKQIMSLVQDVAINSARN